MKISISSKAKKIIKQADPVRNEFQGYSSGTSLAGVLDPLGIVAVPRRNGETITIDLVVQDQADEFWPIGWPAKKVPVKTVPRLFDRAPIEIRDFPLNQVLTAIASAADAAMIFDYRAIEDKKIDMEKTNVTVVKETSYARALEKALSQVRPRMKYEIKLDENNKPFLWVTAW